MSFPGKHEEPGKHEGPGQHERSTVSSPAANVSEGLASLIQANEPYWGGEAEIIRSYWDSPIRTRETDEKWLIHQIYKEYWDGILPPLAALQEQLPHASVHAGRSKLLEVVEVLYEETRHFTLLANLYVVLTGVDYALSPDELKARGSWPENDDLMNLRRTHRAESLELGRRAYHFTEGGYCALFTEGMKLAGRNAFGDAVAEVCRHIYEDEFNHMLLGIVETADVQLSASDWDTLTRYTVTQMKLRIRMRNAQFSRPVSDHRLDELLAGMAPPVKFDFERAAELMHVADTRP